MTKSEFERDHAVLRAEKITETVGVLEQRIRDRFPSAGLAKVCHHLHQIAQQTQEKANWINKPNVPFRILAFFLIATLIAFAVLPFTLVKVQVEEFKNLSDLVQIMEAGINDIVLIGAGIFFLTTIERRFKRKRALDAIHELRSIAHIIDMHQLTKDPERIFSPDKATENSPKFTMTPFQLRRYLDYCTEMLSLNGKIAALYVQQFDDSVALASANEVEALATALSRKIWQKIMILQPVIDQSSEEEKHSLDSSRSTPPSDSNPS